MPRLFPQLLACWALSTSAWAQVPDPPEVLWQDGPISAYFHLGYAVTWLGDVDGDRTQDFAASSPGSKQVHVYSGATKTTLTSLSGGVRHGHSLASLGDLNGDDVDDFAAGTPFVNSNTGEVQVYSGADFSVLYTMSGAAPGDYFGWGLSPIDDTDGDGVPDILVRSYRDEGSVSLHSGATGARRFELLPSARFEYMGEGLAGIHDYNGDGAADFLVGIPGRSSGDVLLHSGLNGAVLASLQEVGAREFGAAVCALGDVDGDQTPDFAIGAPVTNQGLLTGAGEARIYSGSTLLELHTLRGTEQSQRLGELLANGGDYNRDGYADFVVASPGADAPGVRGAGKVVLYSGADASVIGTGYGTRSGEHMPSSLAGPGDAHRDLHPDYLLGNFAYGSESGLVRLWAAPSPWLQLDNLVAGQTATLTISECQGGSTVRFWMSLQGDGPTPTPLGLALLTPPFRELGAVTVPPSGVATFSDSVPPGITGVQLFFQAAEFQPSLSTRLTTAVLQVVQ